VSAVKTVILAFGALSEPFWRDAVKEYEKRLSGLWPLSVIELPEARLPSSPSAAEISAALSAEAKAALARIPPRAYVVALCVEGRMLTSPELSAVMEKAAATHPEIWFLIGSSYGMDASLKARADLSLSFSRMTFPHALARVIAAEQIYRAAQISRGAPYHK
jgi:23S rRNA (pseudouridine1915-N3)-methyltransferase